MEAYILTVSDLCPDWLQDMQAEPPGKTDATLQDEMKRDLAWEGNDRDEDEKGAGLGFGVTVSTLAAGEG